jgi:hypothetical protein
MNTGAGRLVTAKNLMCTYICEKVPFVDACFNPGLENPEWYEKDALYGLDTQITIFGLVDFPIK